jgi:hypothetical protein
LKRWVVCTATVSDRGSFLVDASAKGEDFYVATRGDLELATREDFYMATDKCSSGGRVGVFPGVMSRICRFSLWRSQGADAASLRAVGGSDSRKAGKAGKKGRVG